MRVYAGLRTYATLDVEDATVTPAVLVVADERTLGIGRQGGLAGPRQAKEDGHIPVGTLIGRGVQRQDVVEDGHLVE